jgi:hypothetical protein
MKQVILAGIAGVALFLGGCAGSLPPHEALNQAVTRSFDATGFNYSNQTRITTLTVPTPDASKEGTGKPKIGLTAGLEIVRSLSIRADGAIDMKAKKSEVLYDFHYDRDNVEISIKLPLMMDYTTQTIYVGPSILTTILETAYPLAPAARGKLIRIDLADLLKEGAAAKPELAKLIGEGVLNPKNFDAMNGAYKDAVRKSVARLNDAGFSEQPLSGDDRKRGVERRIRMQLGHDDSISFLLDLVAEVADGLLQSGVITKDLYDVVKPLTDRQELAKHTDKFTLAVTVDAGVGSSGLVSFLESRLNVADREGAYRLGLENISSFSNYGAPRFTMTPEAGGSIDFREIMKAITADAAEGQPCEDDDEDEPDGDDGPKGITPGKF